MSVIIAPSILSADFANLERDVKLVENAGADWIHVDVMDGHFVPNITIGAPVVKSLRPVTNLLLDVHLMIENPDKYVESFAKAGSDIITFHVEAMLPSPEFVSSQSSLTNFTLSQRERVNVISIINQIKSFGIKAGISIKPKTPPEAIFEFLPLVDMVLVMTVEPGFGGQSFMEDCAQKIPVIRKHAPESLIIQVDGGINAETAKICTSLGANSLVAGNYIYKAPDIKAAIESLR